MLSTAHDARRKFFGLEIGRGVATSLVALQHAGIFVMTIDHVPVRPFGGVTFGFHVGVDFFFVLSGFLITWLHWSDIGNPNRLKGYLLRRFTRIYPTYWCVLVPLIAVHFFAGRDSGASIMTSLLLVPTSSDPILGVAWTLVFEVFFYLGFGAIILGGRWTALVLPIWVIAILTHYAISGSGTFPGLFFLNLYNLEFMTGMAVALILRRTNVPFPGLVLAFGILIFFGAAIAKVGTIVGAESLEFRAIFGISAGLIVLGIVEIDRTSRFTYPKWLLLFGTASYSIYLVHTLVEVGAAKLLRPIVSRMSPDISLIIIAAIGVFGGILFHLIVEKRLTHKLSTLIFPERHAKLSLVHDAAN